jgi:hypothetical protein
MIVFERSVDPAVLNSALFQTLMFFEGSPTRGYRNL